LLQAAGSLNNAMIMEAGSSQVGSSALQNLPAQWRTALERDRQGVVHGNDPLPERQAARALFAFIATGLIFLALPGTVLGVWNLLSIAGRRSSGGAQTAWIQAHGQAQLLGWVGSFILGISLYVLPKILGRLITRLGLVWTIWGMWTTGVALRWWSGVEGTAWRVGLVASALLELAAFALAQYLLWFDRRGARKEKTGAKKGFPGDLASWLGLAGFLSFGIALFVNLRVATEVARHGALPVYPPAADQIFLILALWGFAIPVAWAYSTRFVTIFTGLETPRQKAARWLALGILLIVVSALSRQFLLVSIFALCETLGAVWALRVFRPSVRAPKRMGVYGGYPAFIRVAFGWLVVGAALGVAADFAPAVTGLGGASRHALTVGFLATLIFCVAPLILPSFLSGRELWSARWMGASLWILSLGCLLRVSTEAVAYSHGGVAWEVLPVSGLLELTAVVVFVVNLALTMLEPLPAWFGDSGIAGSMPVYFYVAGFPKSRRVLVDAGLRTLEKARKIPRTLTLAEAAAADGADLSRVLAALRTFFAKRQPRRLGRSLATK
jgi:uncharacterized protein involved in response to NO